MITRQMKAVMSGRLENAINGILGKGAGVTALLAGLVMTVAVQSSSITTSILVPLVAAGVLTLRNAFPVTLGANIGTTVTALLASDRGRKSRWTGDRVGSCHLQCPRNSRHLSVAADAGSSVVAGRAYSRDRSPEEMACRRLCDWPFRRCPVRHTPDRLGGEHVFDFQRGRPT